MAEQAKQVQHTPGPWTKRRDRADKFGPTAIVSGPEGEIFTIAPFQMARLEWPANARLIAAAPDLLAELKAMHEHHHPDCQGGCPTLAIIAQATIA